MLLLSFSLILFPRINVERETPAYPLHISNTILPPDSAPLLRYLALDPLGGFCIPLFIGELHDIVTFIKARYEILLVDAVRSNRLFLITANVGHTAMKW